MQTTGLVITPIQDIAIVNFQHASILDSVVIEAIEKELYVLVDQQARRKIILDFTQVKFLASQMLGVLIKLQKKSQGIKGRVILAGMRPDLMKVFTITQMDKKLEFAPNEHEAMKKLGLVK